MEKDSQSAFDVVTYPFRLSTGCKCLVSGSNDPQQCGLLSGASATPGKFDADI
jgi:hypothetical protein